MMPPNEETLEWLEKAQHDLLSAKVLFEHSPPVFDAACFHSQQAAEKSLKAFLVAKGVRFEKGPGSAESATPG